MLLRTGAVARKFTEGNITRPYGHIRDNICELDTVILSLVADLDQPRNVNAIQRGEADAAQNLWSMARFMAYT